MIDVKYKTQDFALCYYTTVCQTFVWGIGAKPRYVKA